SVFAARVTAGSTGGVAIEASTTAGASAAIVAAVDSAGVVAGGTSGAVTVASVVAARLEGVAAWLVPTGLVALPAATPSSYAFSPVKPAVKPLTYWPIGPRNAN